MMALDPGRAQERGLERRVMGDERTFADQPRPQSEHQGFPAEDKAAPAAGVELQQLDHRHVRVAPRLGIGSRRPVPEAVSLRERAVDIDFDRLAGFREFGLERSFDIETDDPPIGRVCYDLLGRRDRLGLGLDQDGFDTERFGEGYRLPSAAAAPDQSHRNPLSRR
jgi:hypothetical protein